MSKTYKRAVCHTPKETSTYRFERWVGKRYNYVIKCDRIHWIKKIYVQIIRRYRRTVTTIAQKPVHAELYVKSRDHGGAEWVVNKLNIINVLNPFAEPNFKQIKFLIRVTDKPQVGMRIKVAYRLYLCTHIMRISTRNGF